MGQSESKQEWHPNPSKCKLIKMYDDDDTHVLNDWGCLERFLFLGTTSSYNPRDKHPRRENAECIDRLIIAGKGIEVVEYLLEVSQCGRTLRQNYLIYALAVCARSNDDDTKHKAYTCLNQICRIPTHFFLFVHYCKQESLQSGSKGWGRAHRRAMVNWYEEKGKSPVCLARLLTKYKARKIKTGHRRWEVWSHKVVLKMAHPKFEDDFMNIVKIYVLRGFKGARSLALATGMNSKDISMFLSYIEGTEKAKKSHDEKELVELIKEFKLEREHIPTQMMNSKIVCEAVIANMKAEAKVRNISLMASKGLCDTGSEYERQINEILCDEQILHNERVHPVRILIALLSYTTGFKTEKTNNKNGNYNFRPLEWNVNSKICQILECAFYRSFQNIEACGKRFLLAISLSKDMTLPCQGCPSINCQQAAAAMLMLTVKTEERYKVVVFSDGLTKLDINKKDSLEEVSNKIAQLEGNEADPSLPILWAMEKKKKFDVFIIYSDNITTKGQNITDVLQKYRKEMKVPDARVIVVAMLANHALLTDEQDPNILNIVGFDKNAAVLIQKFATAEI